MGSYCVSALVSGLLAVVLLFPSTAAADTMTATVFIPYESTTSTTVKAGPLFVGAAVAVGHPAETSSTLPHARMTYHAGSQPAVSTAATLPAARDAEPPEPVEGGGFLGQFIALIRSLF